ncbi:hypothetical protein H0H81_012169 [Sphagnurus paluster]|uniref:FHA domain-containing protein n=1 Tax=Sphagnurus paluster TaxID=117069 RepID=A0A9P7FND0_9AGAR|nr:hypothetical protein H0H81_012169 [Sphagnurus paluster]
MFIGLKNRQRDRRIISQLLLSREHTRIQNDAEWDSLLLRAREPANGQRNLHDVNQDRVLDNAARLWRVAVKTGGWIIIEAPRISDVQEVCEGLTDIFPSNIHAVEPEDATACLVTAPPQAYIPPAHSWVRLTRRPFKSDLAYVMGYDIWGADVLLVPRLRMDGKRKRGHPRTRPPQALFSAPRAKVAFGQECVEDLGDQVFLFRGDKYVDGYLRFVADDFVREGAIPTSEEMALFLHARVIPKKSLQRTLEIMAARRLQPGNVVKVVEGDAQGAVGVIVHFGIGAQEAFVRLREGEEGPEITVSVDLLRKEVKVGDEVAIVVGPQTGKTGWVLSIEENTLLLCEHKTGEEIVIAEHSVNIFESEFIIESRLKKQALQLAARLEAPDRELVTQGYAAAGEIGSL